MTCPCDSTDWHCGYCGQHYVVPNLARSCEEKHERDEAQYDAA